MLNSELQSRPSIENIFNNFVKAKFHAYFLNVLFTFKISPCQHYSVDLKKNSHYIHHQNIEKENFKILARINSKYTSIIHYLLRNEQIARKLIELHKA